MTIAEVRGKCKEFVSRMPRDVIVVMIIISASSASFGLGYLAAPVPAIDCTLSFSDKNAVSLCDTAEEGQTSECVLASKNGTKYYLPSCAGASRISDDNKIWFVSASAAEAAGYSRAANCGG